jgi:hypothetical protein
MRRLALRMTAAAVLVACAGETAAAATPERGTSAPDAVLVANLGLAWWRPSLDLEIPFASHHSVVLTATEQLGTKGRATIGEVSYRVYPFGEARRLFVGVAAFAGGNHYEGTIGGAPAAGNGWFYGAGVDVGWRWLFSNGVALGVGVGVQVQRSSLAGRGLVQDEGDFDLTTFEGTRSGVVPRLRFDVGWAL